MKKRVASLVLSVCLLALPAAASAAPATPATSTEVQGWVKAPDDFNILSFVAHANVQVTCNGHVVTDKTNTDGQYDVFFDAADCPVGATVTTVATKDDFSGVQTGVVAAGAVNQARANVVMSQVVAVPEFGAIAGVGAALTSGGAFLAIRRRKLSRG